LRFGDFGSHKTVLPVLFNDLDFAHLKESEHLESNVLGHHPVKTKASGGHPVECS